MRYLIIGLSMVLLLAGCVPWLPSPTPSPLPSPSPTPSPSPVPTLTPTVTPQPSATPLPSPTARPLVPDFRHVVIIIFENREFGFVIGNPQMPNYNRWAREYTLLTRYYAITHPSLPNYLALMGGDTFGIASNCTDCTVNAPSLPDFIEASGRTWKTYQEAMPEPCYLTYTRRYAPKHNPFIYFEPIRSNVERCREHVVPLSDLESDLTNHSLPNFVFITPDMCHSGHDCGLNVVDAWLGEWLERLTAYPGLLDDGLIVLTWDEGQGNQGCCGLEPGGGRVATVLIGNRVRRGFEDDTPYTHYSLLKTLAEAWGLLLLGHAGDPQTALITQPWQWP